MLPTLAPPAEHVPARIEMACRRALRAHCPDALTDPYEMAGLCAEVSEVVVRALKEIGLPCSAYEICWFVSKGRFKGHIAALHVVAMEGQGRVIDCSANQFAHAPDAFPIVYVPRSAGEWMSYLDRWIRE